MTDKTHDNTNTDYATPRAGRDFPSLVSLSKAQKPDDSTPFVEILRDDWAKLAADIEQPLTEAEIEQFRGAGEVLDIDEVREVYLPLSRLIDQYAIGVREIHTRTSAFLKQPETAKTPFVIGIAGSVSAGKSTVARVLRSLLARWPETPRVELVTTDGFLFPNAELEKRGIMERKGFPESYDRRALLRFITQVKSGVSEVTAPVYSHLTYDIVSDEQIIVRQPDILIVEGLNVLQPPTTKHPVTISDMFDFTIYVDARVADMQQWYRDRFRGLRDSAFRDPDSFFKRFANLSDAEADELADSIWTSINEPNLRENVLPTRARATAILRKESDHRVQKVLLRKL